MTNTRKLNKIKQYQKIKRKIKPLQFKIKYNNQNI